MRPKYLAVVALAIVLIGGGLFLAFDKWRSDSKEDAPVTVELTQFNDTEQNISLGYPVDAKKLALTPKDIADKFLLRVGAESDEPYLITLRHENGIRIGAQLARVDTIDHLLTTLNKSFPSVYENFDKISESKFEHQGKKAAIVEFSYTGPSGDTAYQRINIFLKDDDSAYYLSMQSKEVDRENLLTKFDAVADSFKFDSSD